MAPSYHEVLLFAELTAWKLFFLYLEITISVSFSCLVTALMSGFISWEEGLIEGVKWPIYVYKKLQEK